MKKLFIIRLLLFIFPVFLGLFLFTRGVIANDSPASTNITLTDIDNSTETGPSVSDATNFLVIAKANLPFANNDTSIISSKITSRELADSTNINNDFFVKIGNQVIPIDYTIFSSRKTSIKYTAKSGYYPEIENINLCANDKSSLFTICDKTTSLNNRLKIHKETIFKINKIKLGTYLETLNKSSKKSAKNASFMADTDGTIVILKKEQYGYELDTNKILEDVLKYFSALPNKKVMSLPVKTTSPTITSSNYKKLGLKEKVGSGKSNFRGSPKNRIHNIHNAADKFEGIIIAPNEIFSFVENLGNVDESTGYKEELVIKNNETIPEFGGGICQISTTLFRSAVNTGLEITERRNHAYPVQYYSPQGTDATVYIPKPDLQFKNNTSKYIMLQPHIEGTILTFDIFGTSDGRVVKTEGPTLLDRKDNGDKKYVWWQIVNDKDGNQISKKGFWSYYQNEAKFHEDQQDQIHRKKPKGWSSGEWKKYKKEYW